ncbi:MAG: metal-binding protein [Methanophagales archaeon ANME-1-THS]|nr:MAG: metal-binding protein [Methanophagales archaeon ANME-1-THS]
MEKEELIHLHMLLAQIKKYCEDKGFNCDFSKYNELDISPFQVHRSKEEHKQAIFLLGTALASTAAKNTVTTNTATKKTPKRLQG